MRDPQLFLLLICALLLISLAGLHIESIGRGQSYSIQYFDSNESRPHSIDPHIQIMALLTRDAKKDASSAFKAGDRRFTAVFGIGEIPPGINTKTNGLLINQNGMKAISGTTELPKTAAACEINSAAYKYAVQYNNNMLNLEMSK